MIQHGPTTGQFAAYRKTQQQVCKDISNALQKHTGMTKAKAHALIIAVGIPAINQLRMLAEAKTDDPKECDLVIEACLAGFGWSGVASHYRLEDSYIALLDELNGMNVKKDNDLPPTKENT